MAWFQGALARGVAGDDLPDLNAIREQFDEALTATGSRDDLDPQEAALRRALGV